MTVNCRCGTTYGVKLNFRKHYRKEISIGGYYSTEDTYVVNVPTVPINCRIKNISMGGFGFIALNRVWVQLGDILNVTFALDKKPPEIVAKSHFPYN